ncbi:MAG: hypothetical protein IPK58_17730 [Acidobacteria bacterium]|nr:hypothetical protein [Acidobacteriota bacterium]
MFNFAGSALITWTAPMPFLTFGPANTISRDLPAFKFMLAMCLLARATLSQVYGHHGHHSDAQARVVAVERMVTLLSLDLYHFSSLVSRSPEFCKLIFLGGLIAALLIAPIAIISYLAYTSYIRTVDALQALESISEFLRLRHDRNGNRFAHGNWLQVNNSLRDCSGAANRTSYLPNFRTVLHPESIIEVQEKRRPNLFRRAGVSDRNSFSEQGPETDVGQRLGFNGPTIPQGEIRHLIFQIQDITSRKESQEKLWFDANHDVLTGLP